MFRNILFIGLIFIFSVTDIQACLCKSGSPKQIIVSLRKSADFIFSGRTTAVQVSRTGNYASIQVKRQWKGKLALEDVKVYSNGGCFISFVNEREYLIYAKIDEKGKLTTNICMRSGLLERSELDLQVLGEPIYEQKVELNLTTSVPPQVCQEHDSLITNKFQLGSVDWF